MRFWESPLEDRVVIGRFSAGSPVTNPPLYSQEFRCVQYDLSLDLSLPFLRGFAVRINLMI